VNANGSPIPEREASVTWVVYAPERLLTGSERHSLGLTALAPRPAHVPKLCAIGWAGTLTLPPSCPFTQSAVGWCRSRIAITCCHAGEPNAGGPVAGEKLPLPNTIASPDGADTGGP